MAAPAPRAQPTRGVSLSERPEPACSCLLRRMDPHQIRHNFELGAEISLSRLPCPAPILASENHFAVVVAQPSRHRLEISTDAATSESTMILDIGARLRWAVR